MSLLGCSLFVSLPRCSRDRPQSVSKASQSFPRASPELPRASPEVHRASPELSRTSSKHAQSSPELPRALELHLLAHGIQAPRKTAYVLPQTEKLQRAAQAMTIIPPETAKISRASTAMCLSGWVWTRSSHTGTLQGTSPGANCRTKRWIYRFIRTML